MIECKVRPDRKPFTARLAMRAAMIAESRGEMLRRARRADPRRWRMPRLLWPLFTKGR